jgi:hypothetical protein
MFPVGHDFNRPCAHKARHSSRASAVIQAIRLTESEHRRGVQAGRIVVYPCSSCGFYHCGHLRPKKKASAGWPPAGAPISESYHRSKIND